MKNDPKDSVWLDDWHKCDNCGEPATVYQKTAKVWVTKHHTLQNGKWVETNETESERDFYIERFYCEECAETD